MKSFKTINSIEKMYVHLLYQPAIYTAIYAYLSTHDVQRLIVLGIPLTVINILTNILDRNLKNKRNE